LSHLLHCRRIILLLALLAVAGAAPGQSPSRAETQSHNGSDEKRAREAFAKGQQAEQQEDWTAAFAYYEEAAARAPESRDYRTARERARFQRVQQHVDRAERATAGGQFAQAMLEWQQALALDPGYSVARERLRQLEARAGRARMPAPQERVVQLEAPSGVRAIRYRGNTRGAYEEVARAFGITVDFDREMRVQPVRLALEDVDLRTALDVLAQLTGTYWRAIERKVIYVAENTAAKRREYAPSVLQTVLLSNTSTPEEMTEMLRVVREITGVQRTTLDTRSRTLTLRDEPEKVALAVELIRELEQSRGEVMLEISILEVDRNRALELGILPPSSAQVFTISPQDLDTLQNPATSPQALQELLQRIFGTTGAGLGLGGLVPPLVAFGGGRTVLLATLPGATASFEQTYSTLKRARRMLLRAADREPATFFLGERWPINFSVLSQGISDVAGVPIQGAVPGTAQLAVGDAPAAVLARDFNGDGVLDLVVANRGDDTISFLQGHGDGTFEAAVSFPAGDGPSALAAGDFNADGFLDLAVANENSNQVAVLLGNGDGTFRAPVTFPVGNAPRAVVAVSLDVGGTVDLVVANSGNNNVSVLLGNGDGTFAAAANFPTGLAPSAIVANDFNGDSFADIAVANRGSNSVSILLGDSAGGFGPTTDFPTGAGPVAVRAALLDEDLFVDLATANELGDSVSVLLGNGDGTFGSSTDFAVGSAPVAVAAADMDGLGNQDLVIAQRGENSVGVLVGNGDGTFGLRVDFATGAAPVAVVAANFNSDGRPDLAVVNRDDDTVSIILNSSAGGLPGAFPTQPYPGFQYEDIGLKVNATPRLHNDDEVTLQLRFEIRSLSGETLNGLPVISNRTLEHSVRLREDQSTLLAGILQEEERRGMQGWPGWGRAPVVGRGTGKHDSTPRQTELLIMITPRRIRLAPRAGRQLYAGRDPVGAGRGTIQAPEATPQPTQPPQEPTPVPPPPRPPN
jgi:tetratricopeptide (TPR) repeat protein